MTAITTAEISESDFIRYIENGSAKLTARQVQQLVSELPEVRPGFAKMRESAFPRVEQQLEFLSEVVEAVWTDRYRDLPYGAAIESAFAISYFCRDVDLVPDSLEVIGLTDDAAVVQLVVARNARALEKFAAASGFDWETVRVKS